MKPARGSTFHFTASFALAQEAAANMPVCRTRSICETCPVLVVDDNATNRRLLEEMLIGWRMVPTLAASAPEALAALRAAQESGRPFHLVLTDVQMPDVDGFTLAEAIKKDPAIAGATVVMLTSAGQPGDAARCRELGVAAYLPKPIKRSELRGAILLALSGQSAERDSAGVGHAPLAAGERAKPGAFCSLRTTTSTRCWPGVCSRSAGTPSWWRTTGGRRSRFWMKQRVSGSAAVLMDVQMPEMDGFECTAIIRDRERGNPVSSPNHRHDRSCDERR